MKNLAETAFWVYAACVACTTTFGAAVLSATRNGAAWHFGTLTATELVVLLMSLTMIFGLFMVMPLLRRAQTEREKLTDHAARLERQVVTDPLTGLFNRRYFERALQEYLSEFSKVGTPLCLMTLDLDHFKNVNDTYGHDAGDIVLKKLAKTLKDLTRDHDVVARTGGEEFAIVAPFASIDQIRPFAERICYMVSQMRIDVGVAVLCPTISIGVATSADDISSAKEFVKLSDKRLYEAKKAGRNRVCAGAL